MHVTLACSCIIKARDKADSPQTVIHRVSHFCRSGLGMRLAMLQKIFFRSTPIKFALIAILFLSAIHMVSIQLCPKLLNILLEGTCVGLQIAPHKCKFSFNICIS